jgi:hypothetical protein
MANVSHVGFRWKYNRNAPGAPAPIRILPVATGYSTKICRGVPVKIISDGTIQVATPGDSIYGVTDGVEQYYDGTVVRSGIALPASTAWSTNISRQSRVRVIPVRGQVFEVQADDNTTATTLAAYQAFIQENAEWGAGTDVGDESGSVLDISTHNTTNTLSVRIEDIPNRETQDFTSTGVVLHVTFNLIQDTGSGSTSGT